MITLSLDDKEEEALFRALIWAIGRETEASKNNRKEYPKEAEKNIMFIKRYHKLVEKIYRRE